MPKRKAPPTAWKPGQSGNPAGRLSEKVITDQIRLALNECVEIEIEGEGGEKKRQKVKRLRLLAESIVEKAIMGSKDHAALVLDRIEGKVPQENHNTNEVGDNTLAALLQAIDGRSRDIVTPTLSTALPDEEETRH